MRAPGHPHGRRLRAWCQLPPSPRDWQVVVVAHRAWLQITSALPPLPGSLEMFKYLQCLLSPLSWARRLSGSSWACLCLLSSRVHRLRGLGALEAGLGCRQGQAMPLQVPTCVGPSSSAGPPEEQPPAPGCTGHTLGACTYLVGGCG